MVKHGVENIIDEATTQSSNGREEELNVGTRRAFWYERLHSHHYPLLDRGVPLSKVKLLTIGN